MNALGFERATRPDDHAPISHWPVTRRLHSRPAPPVIEL